VRWPEARARLDRGGRRQLVEITVRGGYRPAAIVARAGVPLRVVFRRDDHDACTERVIFSTPRLDRRLLPAGTTTVDLPAQPAGQIRFTCGMGRYRGRIDLVEPGLPRLVAGLRDLLVGRYE
jgi:Cu+-exporting ATPase